MAKLLLVHPLFLAHSPDEQAAGSPYFPLGLLYLAAYVRDHGHEVAIFDGTFASGLDAYQARLVQEAPDLVGISALLPTKAMALTLAELTKNAGYKVIFGGPDPTKEPLTYAAHPAVDVVVHHEGEQTIERLLSLIDEDGWTNARLKETLGIAFVNEAGQPILNQPRPPIENLDSLPMPARDLIDMEKYLDTWRETNGYASLTITATRGCPYGCDWCQDAVHGNGFRQRSPESVAAEVKALKENFDIDRLRVVDDVDGMDREWIEAWAEAAQAEDAVVPFEALYDLERQDLPMLDVRDSL